MFICSRYSKKAMFSVFYGLAFTSFNHFDDLPQIFFREFLFVGEECDHLFIGI